MEAKLRRSMNTRISLPLLVSVARASRPLSSIVRRSLLVILFILFLFSLVAMPSRAQQFAAGRQSLLSIIPSLVAVNSSRPKLETNRYENQSIRDPRRAHLPWHLNSCHHTLRHHLHLPGPADSKWRRRQRPI